jgi:hypothetical protein
VIVFSAAIACGDLGDPRPGEAVEPHVAALGHDAQHSEEEGDQAEPPHRGSQPPVDRDQRDHQPDEGEEVGGVDGQEQRVGGHRELVVEERVPTEVGDHEERSGAQGDRPRGPVQRRLGHGSSSVTNGSNQLREVFAAMGRTATG